MAVVPHAAWLRTFEAASRHGSFSAAADELGLTPAAVSQQIRLLEKHLKTTLFDRLPRGVVLTDMGQAYAQPVRRSFAELDHATRSLFGTSRKQVVRVRSSLSFAALVIAPRLAEFQDLHPDIEVQLSTFVWADRFGDDDSDVDIRYGHGDWTDGAVTHLGHEQAVVVCSPTYAASFGPSLSLQTIAAGQVAIIAGSETDWFTLSAHYGLDLAAPIRMTKVDSSLIALQAVIAGHGAVMVLETFARPYLDLGLVVAPFDHRLPFRAAHYLVRRDTASSRNEVRTFEAWVASLYTT